MMFLRTFALALLLLVATQTWCSQARWVSFQEAMTTPQDDTASTHLLIQELPLREQPIEIVDAWETSDKLTFMDRWFWSSVLSPWLTQEESSSERPLNPFSWMAQQLAAIDSSQQAAFSDLTNIGNARHSNARAVYEQQALDDSSSNSAEQMLHQVGCSRFRPAMEQYGRQQNQMLYADDSNDDSTNIVSLSSFLSARKDLHASEYDEAYVDEEDYAEDYAESLDVPFDMETEYEDSALWQGPLSMQPSSGQSSVLTGLLSTLASLMGETVDWQQPVERNSESLAVVEDNMESQMARQRLGTSLHQIDPTSQDGSKDTLDNNFLSVVKSVSSLGRIATDALQVEYLGAEDEAVQTADSSLNVAETVVDSVVKPANAFSATLTWSREGGLVMEADAQPHDAEDARLKEMYSNRMAVVQQLGDYPMEEELKEWVAKQDRQRQSEAILSQPLRLSDILLREQQSHQTQVQPCSTQSASDSSSIAEGAANSFAVSWSRDGGLVIESYDGPQGQQMQESADERPRRATEASAFNDADLDWAAYAPGYYEVDDLMWSWVDEEGHLNWGLVVLTLLVIATSVVAVAAVHSYLAMQVAACMSARRTSRHAPRRLVEPLLEDEPEDENPLWGYSHLPVDPVAGAKSMQDSNGFAVEYSALYAQAQNSKN